MSDIIFQCSQASQPNMIWEIVKFGIPSIIAIMAFYVALSQREIASNKYKLDLFDKRIPIYDEFQEKYVSIIGDKESSDELNVFRSKLFDIQKSTEEKCVVYFYNLQGYFDKLDKMKCEVVEIENKIKNANGIIEEHKSNTSLKEEKEGILSSDKNYLEKYSPESQGRESMEKVIYNIKKSITDNEKIISDLCKKINVVDPKINSKLESYKNEKDEKLKEIICLIREIKSNMINQLSLSHVSYTGINFHIDDNTIEILFSILMVIIGFIVLY